MDNVDYSQVVELTEEEKRAVYMEMDKEYLVEMLFTNQRIVKQLLEFLGDNVIYVTNGAREGKG
jgi:hypothetical protein